MSFLDSSLLSAPLDTAQFGGASLLAGQSCGCKSKLRKTQK